jgi:hypothetical protein
MKSILSNEKVCFLCGANGPLEKHHVFPASNRKRSERDGLWVYLCHFCHNTNPNGVHFNQAKNIALREKAERAWIKERFNSSEPTTEEIDAFIREYGINYI